LTKLTGKSTEALIQEQEANLADERYALHYRELKQKADAGDQAAKDQLAAETLALAQVQGDTKTAFQNTMAGYMASSEASSKLFMTAPEVAEKLASGLKNTGDVNTTMDLLKEGSTRTMNQFGELGKATGELGKTFISVKDMMGFESQKGTAQERYAAAKKEQEQQKNNLDAATANQVKMRQDQMETTRASQNLVNFGINPTTAAMQKLAGATESVVSKMPGTGAKTGTSGSGRGGDPGGSGFFSQIFGKGGGAGGGRDTSGLNLKSGAEKGGESTASLIDIAYQIQEKLGGDLKYFSGLNDGRSAKDGKSKHTTGEALDLVLNNPDNYASALSMIQGLPGIGLAQYERAGQRNPNGSIASGDHIHVEVPKAEFGGVLSGPKSGYQAMLHGDEAVIPLAGGRSIPVEMTGMTASMSGQMDMMAIQITKLDELISAMRSNNDISNKILKAAK